MPHRHYFAYRSFQPEFAAMRRFAQAGVDTICFLPANTVNSLGQPYSAYPPIWHWYDTYDFTTLDRQIADVQEASPGASLICIVDLNSPAWLSRQLSLAHESGDSFTHLSECLANPRWQQAVKRYLGEFLRHCETHHADRIVAYVLACGHTDEWFDHNGEICGLLKEQAYQAWRQEKQLPPQAPPSAKALNSPDYDDLLFDPTQSAGVFAYRRFCNELIGMSICEFAAEARRAIRPQAEIGVFYGYVMTRLGAAESGHLCYERVLQCPDIDFIISPGSYGDRAMGGGGGWLGCAGSEKLAGKHHLHECDQRTHTHNRRLSPYVSLEVPHWQNSREDLAGIKREFALALVNRASLWWFDMWGGFYQEPALFEAFRRMKDLYARWVDCPSQPVAQTALIVDPDALYYFTQRSPRQKAFQTHARQQLNRLGAPFECYCFNDITRIPNLADIKFFVFACQWEITSEKADVLRRLVLKDKRVVLWLYAPGLSNGTSLDPNRVKQWTGNDTAKQTDLGNRALHDPPRATQHAGGSTVEETELSVCAMDGWTSAFLPTPDALTPAMLKQLARQARVHLYTDAEVPIYADHQLLAIHSAHDGVITIRLPSTCQRVTDLFTGKCVASNSNTFDWHPTAPDSALFALQNGDQNCQHDGHRGMMPGVTG